jgi:hypothetical protein
VKFKFLKDRVVDGNFDECREFVLTVRPLSRGAVNLCHRCFVMGPLCGRGPNPHVGAVI